MRNLINTKEHGFTMIELLITIIVIGIIATLAIPTMSAIVKNQAISATSNEIVGRLQAARSEAIKRSTNVRVCFREQITGTLCRNFSDSEDINYIYVFLDADNDQRLDSTETQLFISTRLNENIVYKHPTANSLKITKSILFNSKGSVIFDNDLSQSRGQIGICDDRQKNSVGRIIQITNTGRAQVSRITPGSTVSAELINYAI